jgi:hypothetical protein
MAMVMHAALRGKLGQVAVKVDGVGKDHGAAVVDGRGLEPLCAVVLWKKGRG